jgi:hypothetical protein
MAHIGDVKSIGGFMKDKRFVNDAMAALGLGDLS